MPYLLARSLMNGKKGDHPLTDILLHNLPTYSDRADSLVKEIVQLGGRRELERTFDLMVPPPIDAFEAALLELRDRLRREAKERGWEV
ncbi:MAG TPA: hypothetical protein VG498_01670 [Terriglobales bacterium]|nr:hypothetical protein [Terriglobales bacterium]